MRNILIIDDNRDILAALVADLCRFLKDCNILTATNGLEAQQILKSMHVDLVLSDLDMPVMDGHALFEHLRKERPDITLCAMTGECSPLLKERLEAAGVSRYIEKPFPLAALAGMLHEELEKSSGGRDSVRRHQQ